MLSLIGNLSRKVLNNSPLRIPRCSMSVMDDDGDINPYRTTVSILNHENGLFIDSYSTQGFKLSSGLHIIGPCAFFPKSLLHWNVGGIEDVNEDSIRLFTMLDPKLEILVLGLGNSDDLSKLSPDFRKHLFHKKINVEIMATDHAIATFNFLNSENRYVAGGFIPPRFISNGDNDIFYQGKKEL